MKEQDPSPADGSGNPNRQPDPSEAGIEIDQRDQKPLDKLQVISEQSFVALISCIEFFPAVAGPCFPHCPPS